MKLDVSYSSECYVGQCMETLGVLAEDSRDSLGRETFHPFTPADHLDPNRIPADNWYFEYNFYPAKMVC